MKNAAVVVLMLATAATLVAVWWALIRSGLDPDNGGPAVCFTLAACSAPLLAWAVTRRHPAEWNGVLLGTMVLLSMVTAARYSPLGAPLQSTVAVATLAAALFPAVVALRHPFLATDGRVTAAVRCCWVLTIVAAAVVGIDSGTAVPTLWWFSTAPGPASAASTAAMWVQTSAVVAGTACTAVFVGHRYRSSPRVGRAALRPLVLPLAGWAASTAVSAIWMLVGGGGAPTADPTPAQLSVIVVLPVLLVAVLAAGTGWIDLVVRPPSARTGSGAQPPGERVQRLLSRALADPSIRVLYPSPDGRGWVDAVGRPADSAADRPDRASTLVRRGSSLVGLIEHDAAIATRPDAVELVATGAGLLMEVERLTADAAADLERSRELAARLLSASDEPRDQLRTELLVGPLRRLDEIADQLQAGAPLAVAAARLTDVAAAVRTISHGVYPPELTAGGLRAALPRIQAPSDRYPGAVELTAYLAARDDPSARMELRRQDSQSTLLVHTASAPAGVVEDRVRALGGTVEQRDGRWLASVPTIVIAGRATG